MKILIAALDWGLGHTTRIIPVIHKLIQEGNTIIIGATPNQRTIYREHFPDLQIIGLHSISPLLSKGNSQILSVLRFLPIFFIGQIRDKIIARRITKKYKIEQIISDNRYGFRTKKTHNIIITHQLNILLPTDIKIFQILVQSTIRNLINRFNECWVPDFYPPFNLSGALSAPIPKLKCGIKFVGPLSRLQIVDDLENEEKFPEILFIVSGPEYQRTEFEKILIREISETPEIPSYLIIRGLPGLSENEVPNSLNHSDAQTLKNLIQHSKYIICRSGYSTIMDLISQNKTAMLIPTPGQTEQEYLAKHLQKQGLFLYETQKNLNLKKCIARLQNFNPVKVQPTI